MLRWLTRRRKRKELPEYSALISVPSRALPTDLEENEQSEVFTTRRETLQQELLERPQRPLDDEPLFTALLDTDVGGVLTFTVPESEDRCVLVFSSPIQATDYKQTLLTGGPRMSYLASTPRDFVGMLRDLEEVTVESLVVDRCPRCTVLTSIGSRSVKTASDAITIWAIHKATDQARLELYLTYALESARRGDLDTAREVALEMTGHVSYADPNTHLLLAQVAVGLGDQTLLREARAFLHFFRFEPWEEKLDEIIRSGSLDFALPE